MKVNGRVEDIYRRVIMTEVKEVVRLKELSKVKKEMWNGDKVEM